MAANFTFLKDEWAGVYNSAAKAENLVYTDSRTACFHARRALELAVDWIYQYDDELRAPYDNNLRETTANRPPSSKPNAHPKARTSASNRRKNTPTASKVCSAFARLSFTPTATRFFSGMMSNIRRATCRDFTLKTNFF